MLITFLRKIRDSFKKSLKGEEKLSTAFWGWVVTGNILFSITSEKILYCIFLLTQNMISSYLGFAVKFEHMVTILSSIIAPAVSSSILLKSLIILLIFTTFIFYPLLSQFILFQCSKNTKIKYLEVIVKIFSTIVTIGLLISCGYIIFAVVTFFSRY